MGTSAALEIPTTWGVIRVAAQHGRVVSCRLPQMGAAPHGELKACGRSRLRATGEDARVLRQADVFVRLAIQGQPAACPPLHDEACGPFVSRARQALRKVRRGTTCRYQDLARAAGAPAAARAAGSACATNPLPLFIPCHRVLAAGGKLGGFSGGLAWKRVLLAREGAWPVAAAKTA